MNKHTLDHTMAAVPIYESRYGYVDLAFNDNHNIMPIGLGPCSQAIEIYGRHQDKCWGSFPSQWHLQGDTSMSCTNEYNLTQFTGYYTGPQSNFVTTQGIANNPTSLMATQSSINSSLRNPTSSMTTQSSINTPGTSNPSCTCGSGAGYNYSGQGYQTPSTGYAAPYHSTVSMPY